MNLINDKIYNDEENINNKNLNISVHLKSIINILKTIIKIRTIKPKNEYLLVDYYFIENLIPNEINYIIIYFLDI